MPKQKPPRERRKKKRKIRREMKTFLMRHGKFYKCITTSKVKERRNNGEIGFENKGNC